MIEFGGCTPTKINNNGKETFAKMNDEEKGTKSSGKDSGQGKGLLQVCLLEEGSLQAQKCFCHTALWISQSQLSLNLCPEVHLLSFFHRYQITSTVVLFVFIAHVSESFLFMLDLGNCAASQVQSKAPGCMHICTNLSAELSKYPAQPLMAASATPFLLSLQCIKDDPVKTCTNHHL